MVESHTRRAWQRRLLAAGFSAALMFTAGHPAYYAADQLAYGRLVRMEALPVIDGEVCLIPAAVQREERAGAIQRQRAGLPLGA